MKQKEITIGGQQYPVAFTLKTIDGFERITSTPFSTANLDLTHNRMALIVAAALTADENTKLTAEAIIGDGDSVLAFKAGGVDAYSVSHVEQARDVLKKLAKEYQIIFI